MGKIKSFLRKLFRRPAIILVTQWAKIAYKQGVDAAERRHQLEGRTIYLAKDNFHPDHLRTYNKPQFKAEKWVYGYHARLLTMNTLKNGCYYYTADKYGNNGMTAREREVRRRFFIKERLQKAKLI